MVNDFHAPASNAHASPLKGSVPATAVEFRVNLFYLLQLTHLLFLSRFPDQSYRNGEKNKVKFSAH